MRVRHFNIAGVAWSNFKPGININGHIAFFHFITSIDVANVSAGVDEAIVKLREWGSKRFVLVRRLRLQAAGQRSPRVCRVRHNVRGRGREQWQGQGQEAS